MRLQPNCTASHKPCMEKCPKQSLGRLHLQPQWPHFTCSTNGVHLHKTAYLCLLWLQFSNTGRLLYYRHSTMKQFAWTKHGWVWLCVSRSKEQGISRAVIPGLFLLPSKLESRTLFKRVNIAFFFIVPDIQGYSRHCPDLASVVTQL